MKLKFKSGRKTALLFKLNNLRNYSDEMIQYKEGKNESILEELEHTHR